MPDANGQSLPPLEEQAFEHGIKEKATLKELKCNHKNVTYNDILKEVRCQCGAAWQGHDVHNLYKVLVGQ